MKKNVIRTDTHLFFIIQIFLVLNSAARNLGSPKKIIRILGGAVIPFRSLIINSKSTLPKNIENLLVVISGFTLLIVQCRVKTSLL